MKDNPLEKVIERKVCAHAQTLGWTTEKFNSQGRRSVPDRLFTRKGEAVFVEFKRKGLKPTALQARDHERRRKNGFVVLVIDEVEAGKQIIETIS